MKKKVLTVIIAILIAIVLLFLGNLLRNYIILKGICDSNNEFKNSRQGYHFVSSNYNSIVGTIREDVYFYDGEYFDITYLNNELYSMCWYDSNTKEGISTDKYLEETDEVPKSDTSFLENYADNFLITSGESNNIAISQLLKNNLFRFINSKDGNYIINYNGTTSYVNKNTKFITKYVSDDIVFEYNIDLNNVSENNVSKNNLYK